jgi:hypothetical protein
MIFRKGGGPRVALKRFQGVIEKNLRVRDRGFRERKGQGASCKSSGSGSVRVILTEELPSQRG